MCSNYWIFVFVALLTLCSSYIALILFDFWLKSRVKEGTWSAKKVRWTFYVIGYIPMLFNSWFQKKEPAIKELLILVISKHSKNSWGFMKDLIVFWAIILTFSNFSYNWEPWLYIKTDFFLITKVNNPKDCPGAVSNNPTLVHTKNQKTFIVL